MFFFMSYLCAKKNILVHQYETVRKHQRERTRIFFSYYVVKVGEFMKLPFACEDIVLTGFTRY